MSIRKKTQISNKQYFFILNKLNVYQDKYNDSNNNKKIQSHAKFPNLIVKYPELINQD